MIASRWLHPVAVAGCLIGSPPALGGVGAGVPTLQPPPAWTAPSGAGSAEDPWWEQLGDPRLEALIQEVMEQNLDLETSRARVAQAKALRDQALSAVLPQLTFDTSINAQPANRRFVAFTGQVAEGVDGLFYQASTGLNLGLELDLFGRNVLGVQAAASDAHAAAEDQASQALALAGQVAASWYDVSVQQRTLQVLQDQVETNRQLLDLVRLRLDRGEATAVDLLQQRQQLVATEARLPLARAAHKAAVVQLTALLGRTPDRPPRELPSEVPRVSPPVAAGSPADLDAARPDLRAAQERLRAAWRRRLQSERQFLPRLQLNGNLGWFFTNNRGAEAFGFGGGVDTTALLGQLFQDVAINREAIRSAGAPLDPVQPPDFGDPDAGGPARPIGFQTWFNWGVGAQLSVPIFLGGRQIAALRAARATERVAAQSLESQRLSAWAEVDAALEADAARRAFLDATEEQLEAARAALEAARTRYGEGVGDYLGLLSTLVAYQNAQLALVQARRDALGARIALHNALGGDWTLALTGGGR